jgi:hypothetical protein
MSRTCRIRKTHVIDAIHQLERRGMIKAIRNSGAKTIYRIVLPEKAVSESQSSTTVLPNPTQPFSQSGGTVLPSNGNRSPALRANQLPEPLEVPEISSLEGTSLKDREKAHTHLAGADGEEEGATAPMNQEQQNPPSPKSSVSNDSAAPRPSRYSVAEMDQMTPLQRERFMLGLTISGKATELQYSYLKESLTQEDMNRLFTGLIEDYPPPASSPSASETYDLAARRRNFYRDNANKPLTDEFVRKIQTDPLFKHLNIRRQAESFRRNCAVNGTPDTLKRFGNWIARA